MFDLSDSTASTVIGQPDMAEMATAEAEMSVGAPVAPVPDPLTQM